LLENILQKQKQAIMLVLGVGYIVSAGGYVAQYSKWRHKPDIREILPAGKQILFIEHKPDSDVFKQFATLYYQQPNRSLISLYTYSTDSSRIHHFRSLAAKYPEFQFPKQEDISNYDLIITDQKISTLKPEGMSEGSYIYSNKKDN
jgi:hypothetical protein